MVLTAERRRLLSLEVPLGALGLALICLSLLFARTGIPPLPPAPLVRLGIASPLTGMTRSFVALASGDLAAAFHWHPLGPLAFGACIAAVVAAALSWTSSGRMKRLPGSLSRRWVWTATGLVVAAAWARQIVVFG